jgi:hypothetical protein
MHYADLNYADMDISCRFPNNIVSINPATGEPALSRKTEDADSPDGRTIGELLDFTQKPFASQKPILFLDEFQDVPSCQRQEPGCHSFNAGGSPPNRRFSMNHIFVDFSLRND